MKDYFVFRNHLVIIFELLSVSLYDVLLKNDYKGISLNLARIFIERILRATQLIKEAKLIHCDLKPENILLRPSQSKGAPTTPDLKIIDFGSACFDGHTTFQYIQSRYYRSPEVILETEYNTAIDMWSVGCICAELFIGIPLFPGNSKWDQMRRIV